MLKEEEYREEEVAEHIDQVIESNMQSEQYKLKDEVMEDNDLNHGFEVEEEEPYIVKSELAAYVDERLNDLGIYIEEDQLQRLYDEFYFELSDYGLTEDDYEGHDDLLYNAIDNINSRKK
jgi:hypothetical protein